MVPHIDAENFVLMQNSGTNLRINKADISEFANFLKW